MSDYTITPNYQLYKPTPDADNDAWGGHLNANTDRLDTLISSLTQGNLVYTATGGNTPRAAQDRAADVANVLDFGADPTGAVDSTAAFNAACATRKNVYLPNGTYLISDVVTLKSGQTMFGHNRYASIIKATAATFNLSAPCIVNLNPGDPGSYGDATTALRDIQIYCVQPDQPLRANIVNFPPAIGGAAGRFRINRVRLTSVNIGVDVSAGGTGLIDDLECGSLTCGIRWGNTPDGVEINNFHMWNFGLPTNGQLWNVYFDGNNIAAQLGRIDGLMANNWECFCGRIQLTSAATGWYLFNNIMLDTNSGFDIVNNQWCHITNVYNVASPGNPTAFNVSGGLTHVTNFHLACGGAATTPLVSLSGASSELSMVNGTITTTTPGQSAVVVTAGKLLLAGAKLTPSSMTVPFINQTGGTLVLTGSEFGASGTGVGIFVGADNAGNTVANNAMQQMTCTFPTTEPVLGIYSHLHGLTNQQWVVGGTGSATRDGQVQFRRGTFGDARGYVGFAGDSLTVTLVNTLGAAGSGIVINTAFAGGKLSFQVAGTEYANVTVNGIGISKNTAAVVAPGATFGRLALINGTTAGTARLVAYAGTSTTPVTIVDNIGAGF